MRELYIEGVATHGGPADALGISGRQHLWRRYPRAVAGSRAVEQAVHVWNLHAREPGDPMVTRRLITGRAAQGRTSPHA
jgi:hypothetical protein